MPAILPCNEVCPDGRVTIVGPYVPNPVITSYRRVPIPREIINQCPTVVIGCQPWWFFRAHGFDLFFDSPEDVPPVSQIERWQFPENPATLCKVAVSWYEYSEASRSAKGVSNMQGGPIASAPGRYAGQPLMNTGGGVYNQIICDIGNGVNITIPPSGRILADILVPDLTAFLEAGNILPEGEPALPSEAVAMTRVTPAGFLTDETLGHEAATYTQTVFVGAGPPPQLTQTFLIPPLARRLTAYLSVPGAGTPQVQFLFKENAPLDIPLAAFDVGPVAAGRDESVPENAEAVRVVSNGYDGLVTLVFELEF